jgi:hypothetical protein
MDGIPCTPNDNNAPWILQQQQNGEGIEELKQLLFCASLELERTRANAEARRQLSEARLLQLHELLTTTQRERDEARAQLLKLNHRLAEYSTLTNTQQRVMTSDRSHWPDTTLVAAESHELNPSTAAAMHSISSPLIGLTEEFHWNSAGHHFGFRHPDLRLDADLHQPPTPSSKIHSSNLIELQDQPFYQHNEQGLSLVERQESEQEQHQVESHLPHPVQDNSTDYDMWQQQQQQEEGTAATCRRQPSNLFLGVAESSAGGHMTCHNRKPGLVLASPSSILGSTPADIPAHLPEPPESDLQVMLSTLPERGKLLQAVVQAGPLLQTLLMAGPLPQWTHPPPRMDTVQIPKISMCPSPNSLPIGPMAHHVPNTHSPSDPLQVNPPVSSSHHILNQPPRINEPPTAAAFISPLQSGSAVASSSSQLLCAPMFNSQDSTMAAGAPLKFAKIQ